MRIIKDHLSEEEAFAYEIEMIDYYRKKQNCQLTNIKDGGEGGCGYRHSDEAKRMISVKSHEKWMDPIFYARMVKIMQDPCGVYKSDAFRKKISDIVKGERNPNYGNKWSEEQKKKLSEVLKENGSARDENNPRARKIICLETGEVFDCIKFAVEKYNVKNETSFSIALKERYRTAGGKHWLPYDNRLEDNFERFKELVTSLSMSKKPSIICTQDKEIFNNLRVFLKTLSIGIKRFKKEYDPVNGIEINNKNYMYAKDYYSRFIQ